MQTADLHALFLKHPRVSTDTRQDVTGSLFFALSGENFNGNAFAAQALEKGAAFAVIDDPAYKKSERHLLVDNSLESLQQLAVFHRLKSRVHVLAITGTNGKTTTKELIAAVLQTEKRIIATRGNLNNHIGVPLTLLNIGPETEIAVVEMGANHPGEIAALCALAHPDSGIITNIGKAHLEGFGSFEGVIKTKSELYEALESANGKAFVHAGDELLMRLSQKLDRITFGSPADADLNGELLQSHPSIRFNWTWQGQSHNCQTQLYGSYNFTNLLAATAVGCHFRISPENINRALSGYVPQNNRSQLLNTRTNRIILDAYNANPVSMEQALKSFAEFKPANAWLILGDMFELGKSSIDEHLEVLKKVEKAGFNNALFVGKDFYHWKDRFGFLFFETTDDAGKYLETHPIRQADVLVKGSRGMKLERLIKHL